MSIIQTIETKVKELAAKLKVEEHVVLEKLHALLDEGVVEAKVLEQEGKEKAEQIVKAIEEPVAPVDSNTTVS